jgi:SAM-dependent methyltransferase
MTPTTDTTGPIEGLLQDEILRMYEEVAEHPEGTFHFFHGREAAELFGYPADILDSTPPGALASFAGVGNPHLRAAIQPGETVIDLGSGAGLDSIIAARAVEPSGRVIGIELNPLMSDKATAYAAEAGVAVEFRSGRMESIPVEDDTADVVISNGVMNLSFRKKQVAREMFRVVRPGGRISITDIVSAKTLSQSIVNDPKLWAS